MSAVFNESKSLCLINKEIKTCRQYKVLKHQLCTHGTLKKRNRTQFLVIQTMFPCGSNNYFWKTEQGLRGIFAGYNLASSSNLCPLGSQAQPKKTKLNFQTLSCSRVQDSWHTAMTLFSQMYHWLCNVLLRNEAFLTSLQWKAVINVLLHKNISQHQ